MKSAVTYIQDSQSLILPFTPEIVIPVGDAEQFLVIESPVRPVKLRLRA